MIPDISELDLRNAPEHGSEFMFNGVKLRVMRDIPFDGCTNCYGYNHDVRNQNTFCPELPECGGRVFVSPDMVDKHAVQLVAAKLGS